MKVPRVLGRVVVLESALTPDECLSRLNISTKALPSWATWWSWPRDKPLWGSFSPEGFRLQLGLARQLVFARGRFTADGAHTSLNVALQFKGWVVPYELGTSVVLVAIGLVMSKLSPDVPFLALTLVIAALGLFGNVGFGLYQQSRLLGTLERILDAHPL